MLSEANRESLAHVVKTFGVAQCAAEGPAAIIDNILNTYADARTPVDMRNYIEGEATNLRENRKEAEQLLAGILGMV